MNTARAAANAALIVSLAIGGHAAADVVNLTAVGSSGTVNGAVFNQGFFQPAGTGFINSFVRLQSPGNSTTQQGYNTSGRPLAFDENSSPQFTRDLTIGDLTTVSLGGADYYEFLLDANEPNAATRFISLDQVQIFTSATGGQTTTNVASLGDLVYDLDAGGDNWIHLDASLDSGSGEGDMTMLVPVSAFGNVGPGTFVYLFSRFGDNHAAQGGFEEWATRGTIIPTPTAVWVGGACLAGMGLIRLYRRRHPGLLA